jgi:diguanylate cyclase (GGDEF)-like protein/PAS domain S-box-containing protein
MRNNISENALIESEKESCVEKILEVSDNWLWRTDADGKFIDISQKITDLSGYPFSEILGKRFVDFLPRKEQSAFLTLFEQQQTILKLGLSFLHKTNQPLFFEINALPVFNQAIFQGYQGIGINITHHKKIENNLRYRENILAHAQRIAHLGSWELVLATNELFWSDEIYRILGKEPQSIEASYDFFIQAIHPDDVEMTVKAINSVYENKSYDVQHRVIQNGVKIGVFHERGEIICDENGTPVRMIGTTQDITELKEAQQKIEQLMNYDFLTELPNRTMFSRQGDHILTLAKHNKKICAVLNMGIDRFKLINESMGHEAGNELLTQVVHRLKRYPHDGDFLARLGGDEFALVRADISHEDIAALLAQDIIGNFSTPFIVQGQDIVVGLSIGISLSLTGGESIDELSKDAQTAMHRAKLAGGNTYQFYSFEMTDKVKTRLSLESHLRRALENKEFMLYYQPKVSTKTGKIAGAEALIRWQHPTRGLVSPIEFVSVLEDTGLIVPVGEWALDEICQQYARWRDMGFGDISLALNLSAKQFVDTELCAKVKRTLDKMKPNPDFLELEVTESILMGDFQNATKTLHDLHDLGIKLSIDDFGTGYSSLAYLKLLPVDVLKIDRAFVMGLPDDIQDNAIVRVILLLAKALDLKVVAEGVETKAQLDFLINEKCDYIQGYYYSKPVPSEQFTKLLKKGNEKT